MGLVEAGKMKEAAEKIGLSYRQTKRIRKRVMEEGIERKSGDGKEDSAGGLGLGRSGSGGARSTGSVGIAKPRRAGGSFGIAAPYPWFGRDLPPCCLMAAIDDPTGGILAARFFPSKGPKAISGCCGRS